MIFIVISFDCTIMNPFTFNVCGHNFGQWNDRAIWQYDFEILEDSQFSRDHNVGPTQIISRVALFFSRSQCFGCFLHYLPLSE